MTTGRNKKPAKAQEDSQTTQESNPDTLADTEKQEERHSRFAPRPQRTQKDIQDFHAKYANIKFGL